jgi:tetratricopeptide (TPR) repeat protein
MPPTLLQTSQETSKRAEFVFARLTAGMKAVVASVEGTGGDEEVEGAGIVGFGGILRGSDRTINSAGDRGPTEKDRRSSLRDCNSMLGRDILRADRPTMGFFRSRHDGQASSETSTTLRSSGRERSFLVAILLLALLLRVVWVLQMRANPFFEDPQLDQRLFVDWGRAVARGERFGVETLPTAPLYAWFLGGVFALTGGSLLAARLVQAVIGTVAVGLVHAIGRRSFGPVVGLVAAFFAATSWIVLYYDGELLRESVVNAANLAGILGTLSLARRPDVRTAILAGFAWGIAALLRQQVLLFLPCLAVWLLSFARVPWSRVLLFAVAVLAPILPVTAYNAIAGGDLVLISAEGGQTLWIGNNPEADGLTGFTNDTRGDVFGHFEDGRAIAEREAGRKLTPSETSSFYVRKTLAFFREEPTRAAGLLLKKLGLLFTDWEYGNPEQPRFFAERFAPLSRWLPFGFGAALALAVIGLWTTRKGAMARFPLWGFLIVYGGSIALFLVSARYREPLMPVLFVYSACGAVWLVRAAIARSWLRVIAGLAVSGVVYAGTNLPPKPREPSTAYGLEWLALAATRDDRMEEAIELFGRASAMLPGGCEIHTSFGLALSKAKRLPEAVTELERGVELCPESVYALDSLSEAYLQSKEADKAAPIAERSIKVAPHLARAYYDLGRARIAQSRAFDAEEAFEKAVERKPDYFNAAYALGMVSLDIGKIEQAIDALRKAVASKDEADEEFRMNAHATLVQALVATGRIEEAREAARKMVERFPSSEQARRLAEKL